MTGRVWGSVSVTIGTRGSKLALAQTELVRAALVARHPELVTHVLEITTKGDVQLDRPLVDLGDKGLFVAEIEQALRRGAIDFAVHSAKDLPSEMAPDLQLAAFPPRADARDVLISPLGDLARLPAGARVGTSSPRRTCQLLALRPDLSVSSIRGNVDTRVRKVRAGEYDAIVLAAAGLMRLGLEEEITQWLPMDRMLPSVGQGALAIQTRAGDRRSRELLQALNHGATEQAVTAERSFLRMLGAGCNAAVGAHATVENGELVLRGMIGHPDGRLVRGERRGTPAEAGSVGIELAGQLLARGGAGFLAECREEPGYAGE